MKKSSTDILVITLGKSYEDQLDKFPDTQDFLEILFEKSIPDEISQGVYSFTGMKFHEISRFSRFQKNNSRLIKNPKICG